MLIFIDPVRDLDFQVIMGPLLRQIPLPFLPQIESHITVHSKSPPMLLKLYLICPL